MDLFFFFIFFRTNGSGDIQKIHSFRFGYYFNSVTIYVFLLFGLLFFSLFVREEMISLRFHTGVSFHTFKNCLFCLVNVFALYYCYLLASSSQFFFFFLVCYSRQLYRFARFPNSKHYFLLYLFLLLQFISLFFVVVVTLFTKIKLFSLIICKIIK